MGVVRGGGRIFLWGLWRRLWLVIFNVTVIVVTVGAGLQLDRVG